MRARADWTSQLFARRRIGGSTDFLVSVCGYLYNFICSMFGMMAVASKDRRIRWLMILMMCISWPSFILNGARNQIISVAMPSILSILVLKRWTRSGQVVFLIFCFVLINTVMLTVIRFRNVGLDQIFLAENSVESISKTKHLGMNMTEELVMINRYQADGQLPVEWGYNYYANAVNFVPRGLWKDKPIAGDRFAELRMGFYGATIAGTASNGIVGQGVANFGKWLGPIAPAFIVLYLCRRLCMLLNGGNLFLRSCLVLLSLGTLPNLGRDITLIALWPIIFGTIAVIASEGYIARGERAMQLARERRIARSLPR